MKIVLELIVLSAYRRLKRSSDDLAHGSKKMKTEKGALLKPEPQTQSKEGDSKGNYRWKSNGVHSSKGVTTKYFICTEPNCKVKKVLRFENGRLVSSQIFWGSRPPL